MDNPKWIIGLVTAFGVLTLICGLCEGVFFRSDVPTLLQTLITFPWGLSALKDWFGNLWSIFWFDYSFFHGDWVIFKYIFFWPISIGLIVAFGIRLLLALISAVRSLFTAFTGGRIG